MQRVFYAASPMHLICINELFQINKDRLFVLLRKKETYLNDQIYKTLEFFEIQKYEILWIEPNPLNRFLKEKIHIRALKRNYKNVRTCFTIFDFRNSFQQSLRIHFPKSNFTLIDDGFHTVINFNKYINHGVFVATGQYRGLLGNFKKFLYFGSQYKSILRKKISIFSFYGLELKLDQKSTNTLMSLREQIFLKNKTYDKNIVYFIGGRNAERGAVSIHEELNVIRSLNKYYQNLNMQMVYIAKRSTSRGKLEQIQNEGIHYLKFNLPLELELINQNRIPSTFISFGSTLMKTLPILFEGIECLFIDADAIFSKLSKMDTINQAKIFQEKKVNFLCIDKEGNVIVK